MTKEIQILLKDRNTAFRSGNREQYSTARYNLKKGTKCLWPHTRKRLRTTLLTRIKNICGRASSTNYKSNKDPPTGR